MELVDRYIYEVTKRLPEKQREDIEKELRGNIEDMLARRSGEGKASEKDVEAVLEELGEPSALAAQYSGKPRHLIGPDYFDLYILVLKIVLIAGFFGILAALAVQYAVKPPEHLGEMIGNFIGCIISGLMQIFAWVTMVFALIEYFSVDPGKICWNKRKWKPSDLPEIPVGGAVIKRSGPVVGIVFIVVFFIVFNFAPGLFSIYFSGTGESSVPIFELNVLRSYMPLIDICFAVSFLKEIMRLVYGRYNIGYAVTNTVLSSVTLLLIMTVFSNYRIWNQDIVLYIEKASRSSLPFGMTAAQMRTLLERTFLGIFLFAFVIELLTTAVKTVRYNATDLKRFTGRGR